MPLIGQVVATCINKYMYPIYILIFVRIKFYEMHSGKCSQFCIFAVPKVKSAIILFSAHSV